MNDVIVGEWRDDGIANLVIISNEWRKQFDELST